MASPNCWKCVLRPSASPRLTNGLLNLRNTSSSRLPQALITSTSITTSPYNTQQTSSFSTSSSLAANPPKKVKIPIGGIKGGKGAKSPMARKTLRIKKKAFVKSSGRPPLPGERKAFRKRIVLSNNNALEVPGMEDLSVAALGDSQRIGQVLGIPPTVIDQVRSVEGFRITQPWGLFRRPGMLVRREGVEVSGLFREVEGSKRGLSRIVVGERGTGKSMVLLGGMVEAFLRGWVVVNIPNAVDLVNANSDYSPLPNTDPNTLTVYTQRTLTAHLLDTIAKGNNKVLSSLSVTPSLKHQLPFSIPPNMTLLRLAELGARDPDNAWLVFQALWRELTLPSAAASSTSDPAASPQRRPPILITIDGISHLMRDSAYRTPTFTQLHAHHLTLVKHLIDSLSLSPSSTISKSNSVANPFPNGGLILAATSANDPHVYALSHSLTLKEEISSGKPPTARDPWKAFDPLVWDAVSKEDVKVLRVGGLSKAEARGLMEYWAKSGVLRKRVDEGGVNERWALSGRGVVGEMEREVLWMRV